MDLSQLEYFRALAHIRHFTKAAASISISQSALSRSITKLENELGHPLFDRTGHEISLTPDGQRFLIHVERALSEIEEGRRELDHENDPQGGIINLSFIHSLGTYMLPVLLSEFKVQNPSTRFNLQQNDSTLLAQGLIDGTSDLCLGSTMITMKHIAWSYLYSEEIYITVPLHHRLADWEQATLKDIENEPFITMKPSYSLRILTNRVCALANVHPKIIFEGDDTNTIASLVASNLGVSPPEDSRKRCDRHPPDPRFLPVMQERNRHRMEHDAAPVSGSASFPSVHREEICGQTVLHRPLNSDISLIDSAFLPCYHEVSFI
ncbi:LysR family transcriptional regulator [Dialister hominis]|uniref:LysR family transcriptional regulator n=1 Tax=Dialister hominis TaxID=2582419 RepID=UPI003FEE2201